MKAAGKAKSRNTIGITFNFNIRSFSYKHDCPQSMQPLEEGKSQSKLAKALSRQSLLFAKSFNRLLVPHTAPLFFWSAD